MVGAPEDSETQAVIIADAIYAGLGLIAEAIRYHGQVTAGDGESDDTQELTYLDGTPKR